MTDRSRFRVVEQTELEPISDDETALGELNVHWRAAKAAYADLLARTGMAGNLRWLITNPPHPLARGGFSGMAKTAREIATAASALADHLERGARVFDRRGR